ncbi:helix-turn-helix domain-containing protein [Nonomuraea sp. NPDC050153]|uniref:helix-turn-helix domain-containing protein n=1 Tax=Nonomuraea sp. NPDC050153 TaxID=3364359 RepID=UPI0037A9E522
MFTIYVIHAFVVTAAGYALGAPALPTLAKFALISSSGTLMHRSVSPSPQLRSVAKVTLLSWPQSVNHAEADAALAILGQGVTADSLETDMLDFRLIADSPKATLNLLADALVCFVNARGGTVVLGVDDNATDRERALRGVPANYSVDLIRKGIALRRQRNARSRGPGRRHRKRCIRTLHQ